MHYLAISLLAILAGTLLLIKIKKEGLGKFFAFISWFFIVVGFLLFIGFLGGGIWKMTYWCKTGQSEFRQEMMMRDCVPDQFRCHKDMMKCGQHGMDMGFCCSADRSKGMFDPKVKCMRHDSTMKACPGHRDSSTVKMLPPKTK